MTIITDNGHIINTPNAWITPPVGLNGLGAPLGSDDLIQFVRDNYGDTILLSFSGGKDSLALWLYLRPHFEIIPYFLFWVPGLSWVDESIDYYEEWFGTRILRLPHPLFYTMLRTGAWQPPHLATAIAKMRLPSFDFADLDAIVADWAGLDIERTLCAVGFRAADNIDRRNLILQKGAIGTARRLYYYGIWDWDVEQVARIIREHDIPLPADYRHWGRTIAAFDYQFLKPVQECFPDDFERIKEWFPLVEAELFRYEMTNETD